MRRAITLLCCLLLPLVSFAQHSFTGCIYGEDGEPLLGAAVLVRGSTTGAVTDVYGCYNLVWGEQRTTLLISYIGYAEREIEAVAGRQDSIVMTEAAHLEEVVVTGYRTPLIEADYTTSASIVGAAESRRASPAGAKHTADVRAAAPARSRPAAGQLTAGEVNDFGKWDMWDDISKEDLGAFREVWKFYPEHRYTVQLRYADGSPAANEPVILETATGKPVWTARTDNLGRAELWRDMTERGDPQAQLYLRLAANDQLPLPRSGRGERSARQFSEGLNVITLDRPCVSENAVDVAFVVDATGSMGDEISYLASEILNVLERAADSLAGQPLRTASVFYRDSGDAYLTRSTDFTNDPEVIKNFVGRQSADGGGDTPEAVGAALATALDSLSWNDNAVARLLFLVLDAPPHRDSKEVARLHRLTREAAARGIRIIPVVCSGMDQSGEYLMRSLALATNGTYTFLTDDSGIGGRHLEPSTDTYEVEKLNDLLVRLIGQFGRTQDCGATDPVVARPPAGKPETATEWTAYPNPTSGPVTLKLPSRKGEVHLLDAYGKLLRRVSVDRRKLTVDLSELPAGAYLLRYLSGEEDSTRWVIVEAG